MTDHSISPAEIKLALIQFVISRDGLNKSHAHRASVTAHCELLMIGDGPAFVVHLTAIPLSEGGES